MGRRRNPAAGPSSGVVGHGSVADRLISKRLQGSTVKGYRSKENGILEYLQTNYPGQYSTEERIIYPLPDNIAKEVIEHFAEDALELLEMELHGDGDSEDSENDENDEKDHIERLKGDVLSFSAISGMNLYNCIDHVRFKSLW